MGFDERLLVYHYRRGKVPVIKDGLAVLKRRELDRMLQQWKFNTSCYAQTSWANIGKTVGFNAARSKYQKALVSLSSINAIFTLPASPLKLVIMSTMMPTLRA